MANLPDITTADVGIIAFWNAEDHKTAGVVDPTDCTGVFDSYDVYDNGLDGVIALGSGRNFNCRVKNDGWCVAWIDKTNTFFYPNKLFSDFGESGHKGYYDILWNGFNYSSNISSTFTTLSYIISLFEAALETSGDFTFTAADVGHYCYEFTNTNVLTILDIIKNFGEKTAYIQYTNGTTLYHASVIGGTQSTTDPRKAKFEGNTLVDISSSGTYVGVADILAENWMPAALTNYSLYALCNHMALAACRVLILWS